MELDMYAYSIPKIDNRPSVDFEIGNVPELAGYQIHCWRKHPNLHDWMASLYCKKGGADVDFVLNTVELLPEDIDELERAILASASNGFCFGPSTVKRRKADLEFIGKCREEFAKGRTIAYYAWSW